MKSAYDIIIKPVITERSMEGVADKKYVFEVARGSNKIEIKNAVEQIFGVKVKSVNTVSLPGKEKRVGVHIGKTPAKKKAIVTLKDDSKGIELFENMI
ncbi:MAG: 50S ribosomal protein L23 [Bacillota bacterium]|nr:50S ribosomal protein L23 [Bacillota bacterium]